MARDITTIALAAVLGIGSQSRIKDRNRMAFHITRSDTISTNRGGQMQRHGVKKLRNRKPKR